MSRGLYILDESGERPVRCDDETEWTCWYRYSTLRRVKTTLLNNGRILVSTVFLGIDHGLSPNPVVWETMTFRIKNHELGESLDYDRCSGTREQAEAMHWDMVERVEAVLALGKGIKVVA